MAWHHSVSIRWDRPFTRNPPHRRAGLRADYAARPDHALIWLHEFEWLNSRPATASIVHRAKHRSDDLKFPIKSSLPSFEKFWILGWSPGKSVQTQFAVVRFNGPKAIRGTRKESDRFAFWRFLNFHFGLLLKKKGWRAGIARYQAIIGVDVNWLIVGWAQSKITLASASRRSALMRRDFETLTN
jgi:hypothetical protein